MNSTEELIREIITTSNQSGVENLKMLNQYRDLISEEAFKELEDIAINQINTALLNRNAAA